MNVFMDSMRNQTNQWPQYKLKNNIKNKFSSSMETISSLAHVKIHFRIQFRPFMRKLNSKVSMLLIDALFTPCKPDIVEPIGKHFSTSQNSILKFFYKKNQIFGLQRCSTHEDLSIDVLIRYYCKTDIERARVISFFRAQTRHDFGILIWKHVCIQKNSAHSSKLGVN